MKQKFGTFFIVPFYCNSDKEKHWPDLRIWRKQSKRPTRESKYGEEDKGTILPHIMQILQGQTYELDTDVQPWSIYEFNNGEPDKSPAPFFNGLWKPLHDRPLSAIIQPEKRDKDGNVTTNERTVEFTLDCDETLRSPHLFINDKAQTGLLVFHVGVKSANNITDLVDLNYTFHKLNDPCICRCNDFTIPKESLSNGQSRPKLEWNVRSLICLLLGNQLPDETLEDSNSLVKALVNEDYDTKGDGYTLFNGARIHLFTYATLDEQNQAADFDSDKTLLYLSRCVNGKYSLPVDQIIANNGIMRTFENISFASSVEGCSCIAVGQKDKNEAFVSDFPSQLMHRYLWIYLLALMQRFTMLNISGRLLKVEATLEKGKQLQNHKQQDDKKLWELLNIYKHLKVTSYWMDVSPFSQHSQFFHFCCHHLHVQDTYDELDGKMNAIRLVEEHHINQTLKKQEHNEMRRDRQLSWLVAILTGVQVIGVAYTISSNMWITLGVVTPVLIAGFILWGLITKNIFDGDKGYKE